MGIIFDLGEGSVGIWWHNAHATEYRARREVVEGLRDEEMVVVGDVARSWVVPGR